MQVVHRLASTICEVMTDLVAVVQVTIVGVEVVRASSRAQKHYPQLCLLSSLKDEVECMVAVVAGEA